ncbi:MAG: site-specific integrase [Proteobacteria bacterium]|nr:site-specific integrase [Pseudomonadota bacterium]
MSSFDPNLVIRFSAALRARNRQPATVESYSRDALDFLNFLDQSKIGLEAIEPETLLWFRDHLRETAGDRENSVRRKIIGVRQFFRFLAEEKLITSSPFDQMPIPERDESLQDSLSTEQLADLFLCLPESGLKNLRDRALLHLLAFEGLKASEVIDLQWPDLISSHHLQTLTIPGPKTRTISLQESSFESIAAYVRAFIAWQDRQGPEARALYSWIFVAFKGKDLPLTLPHMTRHGLKFMLRELGEKSGLKHLHTESLRHHAILFQLAIGRSPDDIMQHLGLRRLGNIGKHLAVKRAEL